MRLWTLHPRYLDARGLVAAWREGLLAQKVLRGATQGYRHHPQLKRFQAQSTPVAAIASFLSHLERESVRRGYRFDRSRIVQSTRVKKIKETRGQLLYEWRHLKRKLRLRQPELYRKIRSIKIPKPHPLFNIVPGRVQDWERAT